MRGRFGVWAWLGLTAVLVFDVWWRCHTIGPTIHDRLGFSLYPVTGSASEPLDCDEAIYAYIGKRIAGGAVLYRDLTENKPPGGYWTYALAVALGGAYETTIRLMPLPFVLSTIGLVGWLAFRLRGPASALLAAWTYAVVSTDPFLYGNGANMEHLLNFAATAALACLVSAWVRPGRRWILAAGACLGAAALVKQVAGLHGPVFAVALLARGSTPGADGPEPRTLTARWGDVVALAVGFLAVWGIAALILGVQGAGRAAFEDVFRYGPALATDVPADLHAPPLLVRWITGNADPAGQLPWPFGRTNYLVWWGTGSWPFWLAGALATAWLGCGRDADGPRRLVAAWTVSAWIQVALPRLFWAHYYLLPVPGLSVVVAVALGDGIAAARTSGKRGVAPTVGALTLAAALVGTYGIQVREYLFVAPEELTIRDKGGRQWVALRELGRELARRGPALSGRTLFVWGWQSPLFFYSGFDAVTPQLFADDLIRHFAGTDHPLIRPRIERTMKDLRQSRPSLIFCGYPPFPALKQLLDERYLSSRLVPGTPDGRGLWVERAHYGAFETAGSNR